MGHIKTDVPNLVFIGAPNKAIGKVLFKNSNLTTRAMRSQGYMGRLIRWRVKHRARSSYVGTPTAFVPSPTPLGRPTTNSQRTN